MERVNCGRLSERCGQRLKAAPPETVEVHFGDSKLNRVGFDG